MEEVVTAALRLLARRDHSRRELSRKLAQRRFAKSLILEALDRLEHSAALDENRFMESFIRHRRGMGYGRVRIRAELREHGLADTRIETALAEDPEAWLPVAILRARKYARQVSAGSGDSRRILTHLLQRGFTREEAEYAIRVLGEEPES